MNTLTKLKVCYLAIKERKNPFVALSKQRILHEGPTNATSRDFIRVTEKGTLSDILDILEHSVGSTRFLNLTDEFLLRTLSITTSKDIYSSWVRYITFINTQKPTMNTDTFDYVVCSSMSAIKIMQEDFATLPGPHSFSQVQLKDLEDMLITHTEELKLLQTIFRSFRRANATGQTLH